MENEKPNNAVQQKVSQLAARMVDLFMPCDGEGMIIGYAAILVLEKAFREDMPLLAQGLSRDIAETIKAKMEDK